MMSPRSTVPTASISGVRVADRDRTPTYERPFPLRPQTCAAVDGEHAADRDGLLKPAGYVSEPVS